MFSRHGSLHTSACNVASEEHAFRDAETFTLIRIGFCARAVVIRDSSIGHRLHEVHSA